MDEMDKELFSAAFKRGSVNSIQLAQKNDFKADFDENDPLGDLLSSSGENTPQEILPSKSSRIESFDVSKQPSKSKLIADLFGLNEQEEIKEPEVSSLTKTRNKKEDPGDWLGLKAEPDQDLVNIPTKRVENPISLEKDRIVNKPHNTSVVDQFSTKSHTPDSKVLKDAKRTRILSSFISDFDNKPTLQGTERDLALDEGKTSYTPSANREPRRSIRRKGGNVIDPLGLFSTPPDPLQTGPRNSIQIPATKKALETPLPFSKAVDALPTSDQVPEWLGGIPSVPVSATTLPPNQSKDTSPNYLPPNQTFGASIDDTPAGTNTQTQNDVDILAALANLETQAGEAATQQQKSFITALALKRQEETLLKLQSQQSALLSQHEQQLGALVQRQIQRQQLMIKQQEQIQAHIQALMVQPVSIPQVALPSSWWKVEENSTFIADAQNGKSSNLSNEKDLQVITGFKNQIHQLQMENEDLKLQLGSERQRHESYLADLENIFRRQLSVQEDSMVKQEKRFNAELETMEKESALRISRLKDEHSEASHQQAQRMAQLHAEWLADLQRLSEFHQQAVEMLRSEQTSAIEHWKNLQTAEISAVKEANSNARLLEAAVAHLKESTDSLIQLKDHVRSESQNQLSQKQEMVLKQETQVAGLRETLEKQAAALDAERVSLSIMSQDLQSRLMKQQQEANDDKGRFESRERAWEREKFGAIEMLEKEKRQIEKLRSEAQLELADLHEKKVALAADVARLETTLHIQNTNANRNSHQAEQMVAEARATLEAAQEAGQEVQREREEIITLKLNLNAERQRLESLEGEIRAREKHIEDEIMRARALRDEGASALEEARRLERERSEHASDLAQRLLYLKEREDRLAKEKLSVTLQWKKIQESKETTVCLNCGPLSSVNLPSFSSVKNIVDPLPIIMKLEAEQGMDFVTLDHPQYHSSLLESVSQ